jgi:hypothetical protein
MELLTERLEEEAALLLLAEDRHLRPEASENLLDAIALGLLDIGSAEQERKHIEQSFRAGRTMMTFSKVVVAA